MTTFLKSDRFWESYVALRWRDERNAGQTAEATFWGN
jgi:hypothetical protein